MCVQKFDLVHLMRGWGLGTIEARRLAAIVLLAAVMEAEAWTGPLTVVAPIHTQVHNIMLLFHSH